MAEVAAMAVAARVEVVGMEVAGAAVARKEVAMTAVPAAAVGRVAAVVGRWRPFWNTPLAPTLQHHCVPQGEGGGRIGG